MLISISGAVEEMEFMSQGQAMKSVCLANLVQTTEIMNDSQDDASLNRGNAWLGGLEFPEPLGLGEEAIHERLRIPVLGAILESMVTGLFSTRSDGRPL